MYKDNNFNNLYKYKILRYINFYNYQFIETHNDPDNALSDGPNMLNIKNLEFLIKKLIEIDKISKT